jgi:magnesium chelatase subunit D
MAERLESGAAARIAAALDAGEVVVERDGFAARHPARFAVVALDEGVEDDERVPAPLAERLGLMVDLGAVRRADLAAAGPAPDAAAVAAARRLMPRVVIDDETVEVLVVTAEAFGVASLRAPLAAVAAAKAAAALDGAAVVGPAHAALAARLVIAPRATRLPASDADDATDPPPPSPPPQEGQSQEPATDSELKPLDDVVLDAVRAAIPERMLASLAEAAGRRARGGGRAGALGKSALRGRPVGARRGDPVRGQRLALLDTLRAAAPWQPLRRRSQPAGDARRVLVRRDDFRIRRFRQHATTTTVFVVDASGSAALHRLAEAKGAVELLLGECYVRRDKVAVIAFRGTEAELILPPTRSLVRAKRSLAGLPGGGATPLANAIDTAGLLVRDIVRREETAVAVFFTDGRANIDRAGHQDRAKATSDALDSARVFAASGATALFVDTAPRPQAGARDLARAMEATYLPLPHASAAGVARMAAAAAEGRPR